MHNDKKRQAARAAHALVLLLGALSSAAAPATAGGGAAASQAYLEAADRAYRDGNYDEYATALETAFEMNPASYYTRYNLACAWALTGRHERALDMLEQLGRARVDFGMAGDVDLASLRDLPRFRALLDEVERTTRPTHGSRLYFRAQELGLVPEGIAFDAASGRIFFGSMRSGEIFVLDRHMNLARFAQVAEHGTLAAIGMTVDAQRGLLWVIGTRLPMTENFDGHAPASTGVFGFALDSGALRHKYLRDDIDIGYNDVALGPAGELYLSGGRLGVVAVGAGRIRDLPLATPIVGSNGIVASADGQWLLTSSYPVGIAAVRLADGAVHYLEAPADVPLYGIDGMYWHDGALIAVQNGVRPWRLMRLELNASLTAVTDARAIDFANADSTATTAVIDGERLLHIGRGPAPDHAPAHFPGDMTPYLGKAVIMTAPLD